MSHEHHTCSSPLLVTRMINWIDSDYAIDSIFWHRVWIYLIKTTANIIHMEFMRWIIGHFPFFWASSWRNIKFVTQKNKYIITQALSWEVLDWASTSLWIKNEFFPLYASCKYHISIHFACAIISFEKKKKLIFKIELSE